MFTKKVLLIASVAMLSFPFQSDAQLFKGRAARKAARNSATTVQVPASTKTCVYNTQGQCITHTAAVGPATTAQTGDAEYDNYLSYLSGGASQTAAVQAPALPPTSPPAVPIVRKQITAKTSLDTANAKVKILNDRLAAAEKAAADAMVEAEAAKSAQIDALRNTIAEVEEAKAVSIADFDTRIANMTEQLAVLETN